jgi:hypothetical protein
MRPRVEHLPRLALLLLVIAIPLVSATTLLRARGAAGHTSGAVQAGPAEGAVDEVLRLDMSMSVSSWARIQQGMSSVEPDGE